MRGVTRRSTGLVVALMVAGLLVGLFVGAVRSTEHQGYSRLLAQAPADGGRSAVLSLGMPGRSADIAAAGAATIERPDVIAAARAMLDGRVGSPVEARVLPGGVVLEVTATDTNAARAAQVAQAYALALRRVALIDARAGFTRTADQLAAQRREVPRAEVDDDIAVLRTLANRAVPLQLIRTGQSRSLSKSPSTPILAVIGAIIGGLLGGVLAVVAPRDSRPHSRDRDGQAALGPRRGELPPVQDRPETSARRAGRTASDPAVASWIPISTPGPSTAEQPSSPAEPTVPDPGFGSALTSRPAEPRSTHDDSPSDEPRAPHTVASPSPEPRHASSWDPPAPAATRSPPQELDTPPPLPTSPWSPAVPTAESPGADPGTSIRPGTSTVGAANPARWAVESEGTTPARRPSSEGSGSSSWVVGPAGRDSPEPPAEPQLGPEGADPHAPGPTERRGLFGRRR